MRVTPEHRHDVSNRSHDERGITLVFVAICLVVLFGCAAIVIDLGNGWVSRRNIIIATDAGALAAAQEFASGGDGCLTEAQAYVLENTPEAENITCTPGGTNAAGWVTVTADINVDTWFAGVLGLGDFDTTSATTVRWGASNAATGLRPLALCVATPLIAEWLADPSSQLTTRVDFSNSETGQADACNGGNNVGGNWGLFDFDGVSGNDTKYWVTNGYPGVVYAGSGDGDCDPQSANYEPGACYSPQTGELTQVKSELKGLIDQEIVVPLVNYVVDSGGSTTHLHIVGFANVIIRDLQLTGKDEERFIEITFVSKLTSGSCCSEFGGPTNLIVMSPCAVDNRNLGACTP